MKKKILLDLDVVTVAIWDKKEVKFLNRIKKGEFELYTPYTLLDLVGAWKYKELSSSIKGFYQVYSKNILSAQNLFDRFRELSIDSKKIVRELLEKGVKEEDIILVIIASAFNIDYLVTNNRKHLKSKEEIINEVLEQNGLRTIRIVLPSEI